MSKSKLYLIIISVILLILCLQKNFAFDLPYTYDHLVHFYRAWFYRTELLPNFTVWGWDNNLDLGMPIGFTYPFLADVLISLSHLVSFGLISMEQWYGFYLLLTYSLLVFGIYRLGTQVGSSTVGFIAALLYLSEFGGHPSGGWNMLFRTGVWPCLLSVGLMVNGLASYFKAESKNSLSGIWVAGIFFGLSGLAHSMAIITTPLILLALFVSDLLVKSKEEIFFTFKKVLLLFLLFILISAPYSLVSFAYQDYTAYVTAGNKSFPKLINELLSISTFSGSIFSSLGIIGLLVAALSFLSKQSRILAISILFFSLIFLMNEATWKFILQESFAYKLKLLELQRFQTVLGPIRYVLIAFGLLQITKIIIIFKPEMKLFGQVQLLLKICFGLFLCSPFFIHLWTESPFKRHSKLMYKSNANFVEELQALVPEINNSYAKDGFFRVFIDLKDIATTPRIPILLRQQLSMPIIFNTHRVALNYRNFVSTSNSHINQRYNIRYLITNVDSEQKELHLVKKIGEVRLYENPNWRSSIIISDQPPFMGQLTNFQVDSLEINVIRSISQTYHKLALNYFPNWQLAFKDRLIERNNIYIKRSVNSHHLFQIPPNVGNYKISFRVTLVQRISAIMFFLGLLLTAYLCKLAVFPKRKDTLVVINKS